MNQTCFYRVNIPGIYEQGDRFKPFDLALTSCGGREQAVSSFIDELPSAFSLDILGCRSIIELMNIRANGEVIDEKDEGSVGTRLICQQHFCSLVTTWDRGDVKAKHQLRLTSNSVKCPLPHKKSVPAESRRVVDKDMCINYLMKVGVFIPPGAIVCRNHQGEMKKACSKFQSGNDPEFLPNAYRNDISSPNGLDTVLNDSGLVDDASSSSRIQRKFSKEVIDSVSELVEAIGGDRVLTRGEWSALAENTKRKKVALTRKIFHVICEVITPDGKDELFALASSQKRSREDSQLADKILNSIDERFAAASTTEEKVQLLALVSDLGLTMKEIIRCVPSASLHYLNLAKNYNRGETNFDKKYQRERFDENKNDRLVEFLCRSNVLVTQPWGDSLATLSDGSKTAIASVARKFTFSRIHRLYLRDLEASNELHLKLSRGSTTRILKVLAKRRNERMTCVDEFAIDAYEGWRQLIAVVEELREMHGLIGDDDEKSLKRWIRISRSHLEGEYITEICETSNIPQHCTRFALSDPRRKCYSMDCDHDHDGTCVNCDQVTIPSIINTVSIIFSLTCYFVTSNHSLSDFQRRQLLREPAIVIGFVDCFRLFSIPASESDAIKPTCYGICDESMRLLYLSLIRTALSNSGRAQIQESLQDGHALITLDFAMKVLPLKAIEGQSDFFGKRGISLHLEHVLSKIDGELVDHLFAHTLDEVKQDSALVFALVRHILCVLEEKGITKVYLRSDNAGSYKNGAHISSLFQISSSKLTIAGYFFSESQAGKGPADRGAAHCKRKTGEWTKAGNNIQSGRNVFEALTVENETVRGLSTFFCSFNDNSSKHPNAFPGIQQFFSFDFEVNTSDEGVRTRCQYGIGEGKVTKKELLPTLDCLLDVVEKGGHLGESFWNKLSSQEKEQKSLEEEEEDTCQSDMFHCSTLGCTRTFRSTRWLIEHEVKGNHVFASTKQSMTDRAVHKFNELIETREIARIAVTEEVEAVGNYDQRSDPEQGWALKSSFSTFGLNKTAKKLAEEYFYSQRSLNPPRRADAIFMRAKLMDARDPIDPSGFSYLLDYANIPSEKQLTSLFSRLERSRLKGPRKATTKAAKVPKTSKVAPKAIKKKSRVTSSVRSTSGGTRKRRVVKESEESELDDDVFDDENDEESDNDDDEILRVHEDDFIKRIIEEESHEIFL